MCGQMSLTFCKRIRVMARSWARTGHVAVLGLRSLGEGEGPWDLSRPLFDLLASGRPSSGDGCEWTPTSGVLRESGLVLKTPTTSVVEPFTISEVTLYSISNSGTEMANTAALPEEEASRMRN